MEDCLSCNYICYWINILLYINELIFFLLYIYVLQAKSIFYELVKGKSSFTFEHCWPYLLNCQKFSISWSVLAPFWGTTPFWFLIFISLDLDGSCINHNGFLTISRWWVFLIFHQKLLQPIHFETKQKFQKTKKKRMTLWIWEIVCGRRWSEWIDIYREWKSDILFLIQHTTIKFNTPHNHQIKYTIQP